MNREAKFVYSWQKGEIPDEICNYIINTTDDNLYQRGKVVGSKLNFKRNVDLQFNYNNWINALLSGYIRYANYHNFHYDLSDEDKEPAQVSKYSVGEYYGEHMDFGRDYNLTRKLSLTVQLSDENDYEGGDLKFYTGIWNPSIEESEGTYAQASRGKGSVIVFDSRFIHEVTPVTSGTRYSLVKWYHGDEPLK